MTLDDIRIVPIGVVAGLASVALFQPNYPLVAMGCIVIGFVGLCVYRAVRYS